MDRTRGIERRREQHARRLSQTALREAGTATEVGRALGKARSTICHEASTRTNATLQAAVDLMIRLRQHPGVDPAAVRRVLDEACDLEDLTAADDETLIDRGIYLMDAENETCRAEAVASLIGPEAHAEALRVHGWKAIELAQILTELGYRDIDLHAEYRARRAQGARR